MDRTCHIRSESSCTRNPQPVRWAIALTALIAVLSVSFLLFEESDGSDAFVVDSGVCGENVNYVIDSDYHMVIDGSGPMYDYFGYRDSPKNPWSYRYYGFVKSIDICDGVTHIGYDAFYNFNVLESVTMADSVTSLSSYSFWNCPKLVYVKLSSELVEIGSCSFSYCSSLEHLDLPDTLESIAYSAFTNTALVEIYLPDSLVDIGVNVFDGCASLKSVRLPDVEVIPQSMFVGCLSLESIEIPTTVKKIENTAFLKCKSIQILYIPDNVEEIGWKAFGLCTSLISVHLPSHLDTVEIELFIECSSLESIHIPNTVKEVRSMSFYGCTALVSVHMENGVTHIGERTFDKCDNLRYIVLPISLEYASFHAFGGLYFHNAFGTVLHNPEKYTVDIDDLKGMTFSGIGDGHLYEHGLVYPESHYVLEPGCMNEGIIEYVCPTCGVVTDSYTVPALGHDFITHPGKEPEVGVPGWFEYATCSRCDYNDRVEIPPIEVSDVTLTYNVDGIKFQFVVEYGSLIIPITPIKDGYEFVEWAGYSEGMLATKDLEFTAVFSPVGKETCHVMIQYNDGTYIDITVPKGENIAEPKEVYKYYKDPKYSETWSVLKKVNYDMTVYAIVKLSGNIGKSVTWELDFSTGTLTISGSGYTDDWTAKTTPWYTYRSYITSLVVEDGIEYLGAYACYKYPYLDDIRISDTVNEIGKYAIVSTTADHIYIGSGLKTLGTRGLFGMYLYEGKDEVPIKSYNLVSREYYGINGMLYLDNIHGVAAETTWTIDYETQTLVITGKGSAGDWTATTAPWYAFRSYFNRVIVDDGVTEIGNFSFYSYSNIISIYLGDGVEKIGTNSLRGCSNLATVIFGKGLKTVGSNALTGYTFYSEDGVALKALAPNLAGHSFYGKGDRTFTRVA